MVGRAFIVAAQVLFTVVAGAASQKTKDYEYIIVGSGAGGGTLAARLALGGKKVLLIEAGGDHGDSINYQVPVFHAIATEDPEMKWDYHVDHYGNPVDAAKDTKLTYSTPS